MAKEDRPSEMFTDLNIGYSIDPEDKRTNEEVTKDMKKLGIKITRVSEKPPEAY